MKWDHAILALPQMGDQPTTLQRLSSDKYSEKRSSNHPILVNNFSEDIFSQWQKTKIKIKI